LPRKGKKKKPTNLGLDNRRGVGSLAKVRFIGGKCESPGAFRASVKGVSLLRMRTI